MRLNKVEMKEIKTMVYFDLEATGLKSSGKPRITEVSLVAVSKQDVLDLQKNTIDYIQNRDINIFQLENLLPRVMNKLTVCIYPMAIIMPQVTDITGLDNYNLNGHRKFDKETGNLINQFLARLPSPVCLVAHNGNLYDFPLLKSELENIGDSLGPEIMCVDSYIGIKEIFKSIREDDARQYPSSFSLKNLHKHLLGFVPSQSHGAEADCLALLRTTAMLGKQWLDWMEFNCYKFMDTVGMWGNA